MDLTLIRHEARPTASAPVPMPGHLRPRPRRLRAAATVLTGPAGVLAASALLATGFLLAVSDLVARLG